MKKKQMLVVAAITAMVFGGLTACGQANKNDTSLSTVAEKEQEDTTAQATSLETVGETAEKEKSVTGTVDEIKDFMFIITTDDGAAYEFPIDEEHPVDVSQIKEGDKVKITYKGELSEVDAFTGEVVSVEKI